MNKRKLPSGDITMNKLVILFAATLYAGAVYAQPVPADHLWPEPSYFEIAFPVGTKSPTQNLYDAMMSVLELAFRPPNTRMRMVDMPVSGPESATGIRSNANGKPTIFYVKSESSLADLVTQANPPDFRSVKVDRCEIPIDSVLAEKISDVWWTILLQTRYFQPNEESIFEGGGEYHFYAQRILGDVGRELEGWTWSVKPETNVGALIAVAASMRQYCIAKDIESLSKLEAQVNALSNKLMASPP
jgi:hypothetical protein